MEFLKVTVAGKDNQVPVTVNEQVLGQTGEVIQVAEGALKVGVDLPGAVPQVVEVEDTTASNPREVVIECGD